MKTRQKGTAIVEFALILPLLLLLTMITTEFGRAIYQYNTIVKSLRNTTRYLSLQTSNTKITEAQNLVVFGNIAGTGPALVSGLTLAQVATPTWQEFGSAPPINTVTIQVGYGPTGTAAQNYTFIPLVASVFGFNLGNVTYAPISATMRSPS